LEANDINMDCVDIYYIIWYYDFLRIMEAKYIAQCYVDISIDDLIYLPELED